MLQIYTATRGKGKCFAEIRVGWLNRINAELSPKRYWWRPRSQEVGEEGDCTYRYTVTTRMTLANARLAAMRAVLMFPSL